MARPEIRHTFFDMDGVIADTEALHVKAEIQTCLNNDFDIDPKQWDGFKGRPAKDIFAHLIETYGDPAKHTVDALVTQKTDCFLKFAEAGLEPISGALHFIEQERERRETLSLVTSSNRRVQECVVGMFGIAHLFDYVVTGDDITRGKPDPEPYLKAIELSHARPDQALVVEDSMSGIASGKAAGCITLAIATSHSLEELRAAEPTLATLNYQHARVYLDTLWPVRTVR